MRIDQEVQKILWSSFYVKNTSVFKKSQQNTVMY